MTGVGQAVANLRQGEATWLVTSVNGRSLDVRVRMPPGYERLDNQVRSLISAAVKRGTVTVTLSLPAKSGVGEAGLSVDTAFVESLLAAGRPFIERGEVTPPTWDGLLQVRGVLVSRTDVGADTEDEDAKLLASLQACIADFATARLREGAAIGETLSAAIHELASGVDQAKERLPDLASNIQAAILKRAETLFERHAIDEGRLAQEAAMLALRADPAEEVQRLESHIMEFRRLLEAGDQGLGKRLEFLTQELMRETNTFSSKAGDIGLTRIGLEMKAVVDRIREQVANVE
jgi:uncharacterized protein (TIGR00255 family)